MSPARRWRPAARRETLALRATLAATARAFFARRGVLEVETPALSLAANTDPNIDSFAVAGGETRYLHTSPEFPMKRLLAAGVGDIFQFARVFRRGEAGRRHNPEFTMLEWYRLGIDHTALMVEVEALLRALIPGLATGSATLTYRDAFVQHAGLDPHRATLAELRCAAGGDAPDLGDDRDGWLDLLMGLRVAPALGRGGVEHVHAFPTSQAALARVVDGDPPLAARFETWLDGLELANGYHELTDADELARRFAVENRRRAARGKATMPVDEALLAATRAGMPDCAGVAMGFDRVVMLAAGLDDVRETLAFPYADA
ncbi:MAG: EF-P lysine aminoacylase EpmA [Pseudomonadota bacterium]